MRELARPYVVISTYEFLQSSDVAAPIKYISRPVNVDHPPQEGVTVFYVVVIIVKGRRFSSSGTCILSGVELEFDLKPSGFKSYPFLLLSLISSTFLWAGCV